MNITQITEKLKSSEYDFLRNNEHLGNNIILLTVGGSHAYGTETANSDLDIRGCAINDKRSILTNQHFEQVVDYSTDTTIYEFNKLITLLSNCNPNTIELLGNKPEYYFYLHKTGRMLIENTDMFLSQLAINTFGTYAQAQLHKLRNLCNTKVSQAEQEKHILDTIENAKYIFKDNYANMPDDAITLHIAKSNNPEYDTEIFINVQLNNYPLRDYNGFIAEMQQIVKSYNHLGKRNANALAHNKISKHMMHLVRLYYTCFDILESAKIITYREKEHDLLMSIHNGAFMDDNDQPTAEFDQLLTELNARFDYAKKHTILPLKPDYNRITDFTATVNEMVVLNKI